jgi:hypothetical protein
MSADDEGWGNDTDFDEGSDVPPPDPDPGTTSVDDENQALANLSRNNFLKGVGGLLTLGAAGGLGYFLGTGGNENEEEKVVDIPGYESAEEINDDFRSVKDLEEEFAGYESERDSISGTNVDDLLEDGSDIRVGLNGSTAAHPSQSGIDLSDTVGDPEYVLSSRDEDAFKTTTQSGDDVVERTFTRFQLNSPIDIDTQELLEDIEGEYSLVEDDLGDAETVIENNSDLNVFQSTDLLSEQPDANPAALRNVRDHIDDELNALDTVYEDAVDSQREVDQLDSNLQNALNSHPVATADAVNNIDQAEDLGDYLDNVTQDYQDLTTGIAMDMARLATAREVIDQTLERGIEVDDASRGNHYDEQLEGSGNWYEDEVGVSREKYAQDQGFDNPEDLSLREDPDGDYSVLYQGEDTGTDLNS